MDRKKLIESAKKLDIEIDFNVTQSGVFNINSSLYFTFEELFGDILPEKKTVDN